MYPGGIWKISYSTRTPSVKSDKKHQMLKSNTIHGYHQHLRLHLLCFSDFSYHHFPISASNHITFIQTPVLHMTWLKWSPCWSKWSGGRERNRKKCNTQIRSLIHWKSRFWVQTSLHSQVCLSRKWLSLRQRSSLLMAFSIKSAAHPNANISATGFFTSQAWLFIAVAITTMLLFPLYGIIHYLPLELATRNRC